MLRFYIEKGHGEKTANNQNDPGATSGSFIEHDMNVVYASALAHRLAERGFIVDLESDDISIGDNGRAAASLGADVIISCHENAGGGNRGEVIYGWGEGASELAEVIAGVLRAFGQSEVRTYQAKPNGAGNAEYFGILRVSRANGVPIGVIIEPCFLDNSEDVQLNDTNEKLTAMGVAIANAIADAYGGMPLQDNSDYEAAVAHLVGRGIIGSPDYWIKAVANGAAVRGDWMAVVLQGMTGTARLQDAVAALVAAGVIGSPDYWLENCQAGQTVQAAYAKFVIVSGVQALGI
ncbi:MAG: N-acetylmuramoyl-L-alanine amidase [Syntrophomonadaceae bacterium]